jgi:NAD(P)-dependent dehydrogenase (short-subunit alcohol dehydrogenase family)
MPDLHGRVALVTGATAGIGLATAAGLARRGARTLLGFRAPRRGVAARESILAENAGASVELIGIDLASLDSIEDAAAEIADRTGKLDILVNNAGVMAPPPDLTADGFELQIGTNHLGHFALTGRLLPLLLAAEKPRVVTVASLAHHGAVWTGLSQPADFKTLPHGSRWLGYCRSKLANLLFALELERLTRANAPELRSIPVHPGLSRTELVARAGIGRRRVIGPIARAGYVVGAQSTADGALPSLYAAAHPEAAGGQYLGPRLGVRGAPARATASRSARDPELAKRLWAASVEATGVGYEELSTTPMNADG